MTSEAIYICSARRTPIGNFRGVYANTSAVELGSAVVQAILNSMPFKQDVVGECIMGCVLQGGLGQAPARQAWIRGGGSAEVPCTTVNRVCGSGMQAIVNASRGILLNEYDVAVAGGMENMTMTPYALPRARDGYQLGVPNAAIIDMLVHDGLWDPYENLHMGNICEQVVAEYGISRARQDAFAVRSYERALKASADGWFKKEIVPMTVTHKKEPILVTEDEGPRLFHKDKMAKLRPAFERNGGTITAGNASSINDGAAAVLLANEAGCKRMESAPVARVVDWCNVATEPGAFPLTPALAIEKLLHQNKMTIRDIDCIEINEAFSAVPLLAIDKLKLDESIVNPLGGAVAIGHPIGASGARIVATLLSSLAYLGGRRGIATLCIGGGEGIAILIEHI